MVSAAELGFRGARRLVFGSSRLGLGWDSGIGWFGILIGFLAPAKR